MLGFVRGKIISKSLDSTQCVVLAHRIGFEITLPRPLFDRLEAEQMTSLWLHTHVREEAITLFGFETDNERQLFRTLLGVSGLGPKTAMTLLATHATHVIPQLIMAKDSDALSEAPGVGKKLAQKIVLELSGKMEKLAWVQHVQDSTLKKQPPKPPARVQLKDDLSSALQNLGYAPNSIRTVLEKLFDRESNNNKSVSFEELLRHALKDLAGRPLPKTATDGALNG